MYHYCVYPVFICNLFNAASYASRVTQYGSNLRFTKVTDKDTGLYDCEVSGQGQFKEVRVKLTVLGKEALLLSKIFNYIVMFFYWICLTVPPGVPLCRVPSSVTTGNAALLSCWDTVGSPPPTYKWFKDGILLPSDPTKITGFKNATYKLNPENGNLVSSYFNHIN